MARAYRMDTALSRQDLESVYTELRRLARGYLSRERGGHTLQPTALVHEAYLRLIQQEHLDWHNKQQLVGVAARMMRHILIDHARAKATVKRRGEAGVIEIAGLNENRVVHWIDLGTALEKLESIDPELVRIVELRFFGGFSIQETAALLNVGPASVKRLWGLARSWLYQELGS